jgi:hypothetical protein|tara:strand:+ start:396 stop:509 length:114 start_codon:yes stop_codon:yes gene_type:complete
MKFRLRLKAAQESNCEYPMPIFYVSKGDEDMEVGEFG